MIEAVLGMKTFSLLMKRSHYKAVGEISPEYIFYPHCLERIKKIESIQKFLLMLRNPVNRAYSYYGLKVRNTNYTGTFEEFIDEFPATTKRGNYSQYMELFLEYFDRDQLLVLITEKAVSDVSNTKNTLANFLDISANLFPEDAGTKRVNSSYTTRAPAVYALMVQTSVKLRRWDKVTDLARRMGVKRMFRSSKSLPPMKPETRQYLENYYADEINHLETVLDVSLDCWRSG